MYWYFVTFWVQHLQVITAYLPGFTRKSPASKSRRDSNMHRLPLVIPNKALAVCRKVRPCALSLSRVSPSCASLRRLNSSISHGESATPAVPCVPEYLVSTYWWAYVSPKAIKFFERPWLANLILWGNYRRLGDAALTALGAGIAGHTLQIACVYGNLTPRIAAALPEGGSLTVVDVVQGQLDNLARKLPPPGPGRSVQLQLANSASLPFSRGAFDRALLFFLLHEMPVDVRRATLAEALRVLRPGGRLVIVDYHQPVAWHPLRLPMEGVLRTLEPFAMDLWEHPLETWLPSPAEAPPSEPESAARSSRAPSDSDSSGASGDGSVRVVERRTVFGGLYQIVVFEKQAAALNATCSATA